MYSKDSASIKLNQYISEEFNCHKGVKQGCMLSPTLFNIYLNDLPDILSNDTSAPLLNGTQISCLLYADDLVIFSTTKSGLQENINRLLKFGKVNNLQVNESKTKILIFNPNGRKLNRYAFTNENKQLELTTEYKYLGLMLNASGTFTKTKQEIKKVALKAFYFLRKSMGPFFHKDVLLSVHLFNTLIMPILTYCGDVWGLDGSYNEMRDPIEQVHSKFCKQILGVSKRATNKACRAELGRLPILIDIKTQIIKYWFRLQTLDENRLLKQAYLDMIETRPSNKKTWALQIKSLLFQVGFGYLWNSQSLLKDHIKESELKVQQKLFNQRIRDIAIQDWRASLFEVKKHRTGGNKLRTFREYKTEYCFESYLKEVSNPAHRRALTKLRISDHSLEFERGRYKQTYVQPKDRHCSNCAVMEDERHFVLTCPLYTPIRDSLFTKIGQLNNFRNFIAPKKNIREIAKFVFDCFQIRNSLNN